MSPKIPESTSSGLLWIAFERVRDAPAWTTLLGDFSRRPNGTLKQVCSISTFSSSSSILSTIWRTMCPRVSEMAVCMFAVASFNFFWRVVSILGKNGLRDSSKTSAAIPYSFMYSFFCYSFMYSFWSPIAFKKIFIRSVSVISFTIILRISSIPYLVVWASENF